MKKNYDGKNLFFSPIIANSYFYIGYKGVIFGDFFAYKIFNIDAESTKIVTNMQTMDIITKKNLEVENFENIGQNWTNFDK